MQISSIFNVIIIVCLMDPIGSATDQMRGYGFFLVSDLNSESVLFTNDAHRYDSTLKY